MVHLHRVANEWLPLLLSLLISTAATLVVTALVMKLLMPAKAAPGETP
jgi:holin-like protein